MVVACELAEPVERGAHPTSPRRLEDDLYPDDLIMEKPYKKDKNRWLVFLHCIGIGYCLLGVNTVCDVYFTGAINIIVEKSGMKPDVAGATFMAAGGSAPEFFTSLVGATVAFNDVGFSTVVGSAVFNVLFVIGACGYFAPKEIDLSWWPLFRDCSFYIVGLSVLAGFAANERIGIAEAIILFLLYLGYCTLMYFNPTLEEFVLLQVSKRNKVVPEELAKGAATYGKMEEDVDPMEAGKKYPADGGGAKGGSTTTGSDDATQKCGNSDDADEEDEDFMKMPEGNMERVIWALSLPIYAPLRYSIPWPSDRWFIVTFLLSLLWISCLSFLLVWWTSILGEVLHIPTVIQGFTLLAAGTSIPDAVSSVAVTKQGEGDMAISSSIGSNIFDILVGLPIPWMIKIWIEMGSGHPDFEVKILSPYLTFYVLLLLFMVFAVVISIHLLGWKLNKVLGAAMAGLYAVFLITACTVELTKPKGLRTKS